MYIGVEYIHTSLFSSCGIHFSLVPLPLPLIFSCSSSCGAHAYIRTPLSGFELVHKTKTEKRRKRTMCTYRPVQEKTMFYGSLAPWLPGSLAPRLPGSPAPRLPGSLVIHTFLDVVVASVAGRQRGALRSWRGVSNTLTSRNALLNLLAVSYNIHLFVMEGGLTG